MAYRSASRLAGKRKNAKQAVVPLDDAEVKLLRSFARGVLRLGETHLREAQLLSKRDDTPNACAHAAYYAMLHCAAAGLYLEGKTGKTGRVVESHEHLLQHYANLVKDEPAPLSETANWLNEARASRVRADYGIVRGGATIEDARENCANAVKFFEAFREKWHLDMPQDSMENLSLTRNLEKLLPEK